MVVKTLIALALLASLPVPRAAADDFYTTCRAQGGTVEILRENKLKPGATLAQFEKAVALHIKWYRDQGITDNRIVVFSVGDTLPGTMFATTDPTLVGELHIDPPVGHPLALNNADFKAFIAAYAAISTLEMTQPLCVQKAP